MTATPQTLAHAQQALQTGDVETALAVCAQLAQQSPEDPRILLEFGRALSAAGRYQDARSHFQHILRTRPRNGDTHFALGLTFQLEGDSTRAEEIFEHGLVHRPVHPMLLAGKASCLNAREAFEEAYVLLSPLVEQGQTPFPVLSAFADACSGCGRTDEATRLVKLAVDTQPMTPSQRMLCLFRLGDAQERAGDPNAAMRSYTLANGLYPRSFDGGAYSAAIDHAIDCWTPSEYASLPRAGMDLDVPVFVVGMPRAGVGLIDRILGQHPEVASAGPLATVTSLANRLVLGTAAQEESSSLEGLTTEAIEMAANEYVIDLVDIAPTASRVVDSHPFNFLHLSLIRLMFPKARIVHCTRDPMDVCFACYAHHFTSPIDFAYDLDNIAAFHSDYRRMVEHQVGALEIPAHEVAYESLCNDPTGTINGLLEFLELEPDGTCLELPIHTDRVGRHRAFGEHLASLRTGLGL